MGCNCSLTEKIIGILVIIFAWWQTGFNDWILTILGIILIWHAFRCNICNNVVSGAKSMPARKPVAKKATKKKRKR